MMGSRRARRGVAVEVGRAGWCEAWLFGDRVMTELALATLGAAVPVEQIGPARFPRSARRNSGDRTADIAAPAWAVSDVWRLVPRPPGELAATAPVGDQTVTRSS